MNDVNTPYKPILNPKMAAKWRNGEVGEMLAILESYLAKLPIFRRIARLELRQLGRGMTVAKIAKFNAFNHRDTEKEENKNTSLL